MHPSLSESRHLYRRAEKNAKLKSKDAFRCARHHDRLLRKLKRAHVQPKLTLLLKDSETALVHAADALDMAAYELSTFYTAAIEVGEDEATTIYELLDSLEFLSVHCRREARQPILPEAAYLLLAERLVD
jgi:hypothetical protein